MRISKQTTDPTVLFKNYPFTKLLHAFVSLNG